MLDEWVGVWKKKHRGKKKENCFGLRSSSLWSSWGQKVENSLEVENSNLQVV